MKSITTIAACRRLPLACVLLGTLALASCGGGGGGSAAVAAPSNVIASFLDIMPGLNFFWSTSQQASVGITLTRASGAALGDLKMVLSTSTCDDPTGGGGQLVHPVRTSVLIAVPLTDDQQRAASATLDLGQLQLQIPAAASHVLVEVLDNNDPSLELYSKLVRPADLASLAIVIPRPQTRDATGQPTSPSPLASCANPG